jgi:uncharacterized membrane protein (DUF373 family)
MAHDAPARSLRDAGDDAPNGRRAPAGRQAAMRPRRSWVVHEGIGGAETAIYVVVAILLVVAAAFTLVGTISDVFRGAGSRHIADTGVFLLDRVLLMFMIAELLYTLRLVNFGGRIYVEPFLLIGLIAVVRRILVITAQFEGDHRQLTDFVLQIGALSALALVLAAAIHLLRRSSAQPEPRPGRAQAPPA